MTVTLDREAGTATVDGIEYIVRSARDGRIRVFGIGAKPRVGCVERCRDGTMLYLAANPTRIGGVATREARQLAILHAIAESWFDNPAPPRAEGG